MEEQGATCYRRFLEGDEDAFAEILDLYRDPLIFFLNRTVHNLSVAEDLAADSFAELIVHPKRYNFNYSFKTYLFAIGHHKMVNHIRRSVRAKTVSLDEIEYAEPKSSEYASFEEKLFQDERKRAVHQALEVICEEYRMALYLYYMEEMSYQEIGKIMKKSLKQVDNLLYRGKQALKRELERSGFGHEESN